MQTAGALSSTLHNFLPFFVKHSNELFMHTTIMVCSIGNNDSPMAGWSTRNICLPSSHPLRSIQMPPSLVAITIRKSMSTWPLTDSSDGVALNDAVRAWNIIETFGLHTCICLHIIIPNCHLMQNGERLCVQYDDITRFAGQHQRRYRAWTGGAAQNCGHGYDSRQSLQLSFRMIFDIILQWNVAKKKSESSHWKKKNWEKEKE